MLFAATQKGFGVLAGAIDMGYASNIGCVVTFKEKVAISFEHHIIRLCEKHCIPAFYWSEAKGSLESKIVQFDISSLIAIGWRYLLPLSLNKLLCFPMIVFHDSLLPKYRGFAPTPTAIIAGECKVGVTALFASNEIDNGEIIWQKVVPVGEHDYIQDVINKQSDAYIEGFMYMLDLMCKNKSIPSIPQEEKLATYSIWRTREDCRINWKTDSRSVFNFVRALGTPYPGAYTYYKEKRITVLRTSLIPDLTFAIRDCGKLWAIKENRPQVICGIGMISIDKAIDESGQEVIFDTLRYKLH